MDDKTLRQEIIDALDWDPSVDSANIGVAADDGVVTLTGHVINYAQKLEADRVVKRVKGVEAVADEIEVRYAGAIGHTDEDIAHRAVQVLFWDVVVPDDAVKVKVSKGWITLDGEVEWDFQRRAAEADVRRLAGVLGVSDQVTLKSRVQLSDVSRRIEAALKRDAELEAGRIHVSALDGKVTLEGKVHNWHERDAAQRAAWSAPGVHAVVDHIQIG
jgi:osmotically-inducible protein OsmY